MDEKLEARVAALEIEVAKLKAQMGEEAALHRPHAAAARPQSNWRRDSNLGAPQTGGYPTSLPPVMQSQAPAPEPPASFQDFTATGLYRSRT